jgi:hypothetical protein
MLGERKNRMLLPEKKKEKKRRGKVQTAKQKSYQPIYHASLCR